MNTTHPLDNGARICKDYKPILTHPFFTLSIGAPKTGKTMFLMKLIEFEYPNGSLVAQFDMVICVIPCVSETLKPFLFEYQYAENFLHIVDGKNRELFEQVIRFLLNSDNTKRILLFIDDMSGSPIVHESRAFKQLVNISRNKNLSISLISHQMTSMNPSIRCNATAFLIHAIFNPMEQEKVLKEIKIANKYATYKENMEAFKIITKQLVEAGADKYTPLVIYHVGLDVFIRYGMGCDLTV